MSAHSKEFRTKKWLIDLTLYSQWDAILRPGDGWNWIDLTILLLSFEFSPYKSSREFNIGILGFTLCVTFWLRTEWDKGER